MICLIQHSKNNLLDQYIALEVFKSLLNQIKASVYKSISDNIKVWELAS